MKKPYLYLWLLAVLATIAGMPYAFELQSAVLERSPIPFPALVIISIVQTALLLGIAVYGGKKAARVIGLKVFALDGGRSVPKSILKLGVPWGILVGIAIYAVDMLLASTLTPEFSVGTVHPALWKTLLASLYGGVVEEVLMRLFLMTVLAWVIGKIFRVKEPVRNRVIVWSAIVISAVIFGLGHLPVTAALTTITPAIVFRAVLLNGIGGLVFGWLYWRKGLEYGIVAHATTDIVLLAVLPVLLG